MKCSASDELIARLKDGANVVTINRRMSRVLRAAYDAAISSSGAGAWPTPVIMPLPAWLESLWETAWQPAALMNESCSLAVWERIIASDKALPHALPGRRSLAALAYEAYSIINEYDIKLRPDEPFLSEEAAAFRRWLRTYEEASGRTNAIDSVALAGRVISLIGKGVCVLPRSIIFAGFDEFTPVQNRLIGALRARGVDVNERVERGASPLQAAWTVRPYADEREEVEQAGRWVRKTARPGWRIGIICPELDRYRDLIKREFDAELSPASALPHPGRSAVYNISLGPKLSDEPLVRAALDIIAIGPGAIGLDRLSPVLLSPYLAIGNEHLVLAGVDAALKRDGRLKASLAEVRRRLDNNARLAVRFGRWIGYLNEAPLRQSHTDWAHAFDALLKDIGIQVFEKGGAPLPTLKKGGWEGFALSSSEYQALQAWQRLLYTFASLDDVADCLFPEKADRKDSRHLKRGDLTLQEAVARLSAMASDTIHQPETPANEVEVLGLLEASGIEFDSIWLMGCHDGALPASPSPNPFIPLDVQRAFDCPHSSHERELVFAKRAVERVLCAAPSVIVSYPQRLDEREMRVSAFFAATPSTVPSLKEAADLRPSQPVSSGEGAANEHGLLIESSSRLKDVMAQQAACHAPNLEEMPEEPWVPLNATELVRIKGGTAILKDQALCPFKAFATYRLNACGIAVPQPGLRPEDKGSLLHAAMRRFWDKVEGSVKLEEMTNRGEIDGYVALIAEDIFNEVRLPYGISPTLIKLEKERIRGLLLEWAKKELKRGPFKVKAVEIKKELNIAGLPITCRLDRIDTVADGEVIIDYKTGMITALDLENERPADPQLLIYSLTGRYDALSFARVIPGDCRFVGLAKADALLPGVSQPKEGDWEGLMELWKTTVEGLARDFMAGYAAVDPNPELTGQQSPCKHCDQTVLCRITETGNLVAQDARE